MGRVPTMLVFLVEWNETSYSTRHFTDMALADRVNIHVTITTSDCRAEYIIRLRN